MDIRPVEEIISEIRECYERDPLGWKMLRGKDRMGHTDTYIMHKKALWQMKCEFKSPIQPKGVGTRIEEKPINEMEFLMEHGSALPFGEIYNQEDRLPILTMGIGRYSPRAANELKGLISSKQENLERDLSESLNRLLHREGIYKEYL
jgi:hypothetical protein